MIYRSTWMRQVLRSVARARVIKAHIYTSKFVCSHQYLQKQIQFKYLLTVRRLVGGKAILLLIYSDRLPLKDPQPWGRWRFVLRRK